MKAVTIPSPGDADALVLDEVDAPTRKPGEVLLDVAYAGVNRPDVLQRRGLYPLPADASPLPGLEVSGTVVEADADGPWKVGDRVCALCNGGGYAERVAVPQGQVLAVPEGLSMAEAAALPETFFTVWYNLFQIGDLKKGEVAFVHGGASGIGTTAIQLAVAFGAEVLTTAGAPDRCQACVDLGASLAVDYKQDDFVARIEKAHPDGVDVVLDMVGGDYVPRNLSLLRDRGRHLSIAFLRGPSTELNLAIVMRRRLTLTGSTLRPRTPEEKATIAQGLKKKVWPLLAAGKVRPVMDETFPLARAADAHEQRVAPGHADDAVDARQVLQRLLEEHQRHRLVRV
ncbi:MAG: NAD(P)H-quinone oxidoreductase, partial [Planctomycetota bacterium]